MRFEFNSTPVELVSGEALLFDGAFECRPGDRVLVVGANGVGKSTFLMLIHSSCSHPEIGGSPRTWGHIHTIEWPRVVVTDLRACTPGHVFQEPRENFICRVSSDELVLPLLHSGFDAQAMIERLATFIDAADAHGRDIWRRRIDELSSGEQQRIAIAAALAPDPPLLLWDEALARVDDGAAVAIRELLASTYQNGVLLAVTHRPWRYRKLVGPVTSIIFLERAGNRISIRQRSPDELDRIKENGKAEDVNFIDRRLWREFVAPHDAIESLFKNGMRIFPGQGQARLELRNLAFFARGSREPIATLRSGRVTEGLSFVVGRNGAGKTLLLQMLCGQIPANSFFRTPRVRAEVHIENGDNLALFGALRREGLSVYLPAEPFRWITEPTVEGELSLFNKDAELERRLGIATSCGLSREQNPEHMSYGQRKLLALLSLPNRCELVCLDEPFADLGTAYITALEEFIASQLTRGHWRSVVMSHSSDVTLTAR